MARAVAPTAGGKNFDLILHTADANGGTLDPAFDAHLQPLQSLALAWWQEWQNRAAMTLAVRRAQETVINNGTASWGKVTGPISAAIASANRIGWTFTDGHLITCDDGCKLALQLDPFDRGHKEVP